MWVHFHACFFLCMVDGCYHFLSIHILTAHKVHPISFDTFLYTSLTSKASTLTCIYICMCTSSTSWLGLKVNKVSERLRLHIALMHSMANWLFCLVTFISRYITYRILEFRMNRPFTFEVLLICSKFETIVVLNTIFKILI